MEQLRRRKGEPTVDGNSVFRIHPSRKPRSSRIEIILCAMKQLFNDRTMRERDEGGEEGRGEKVTNFHFPVSILIRWRELSFSLILFVLIYRSGEGF